jgi:phosphoglycerate dehydrogenase-like enzyme
VASRAREGVHGIAELAQLLPEHDVVVLTVPLNDSTRGLVDAGFLARLPDGALLVNVARGGVVDSDALLRELRTGRIIAAVDVIDPEPLPAGHPLWDEPGLLMTPHVGGASTAFRPRALALLRAMVERIASGHEPANVVVGPR